MNKKPLDVNLITVGEHDHQEVNDLILPFTDSIFERSRSTRSSLPIPGSIESSFSDSEDPIEDSAVEPRKKLSNLSMLLRSKKQAKKPELRDLLLRTKKALKKTEERLSKLEALFGLRI